jgi:hypothetical protein
MKKHACLIVQRSSPLVQPMCDPTWCAVLAVTALLLCDVQALIPDFPYTAFGSDPAATPFALLDVTGPTTNGPRLTTLDAQNMHIASAVVTVDWIAGAGRLTYPAAAAPQAIVSSLLPYRLTLTGAGTVNVYEELLRDVGFAAVRPVTAAALAAPAVVRVTMVSKEGMPAYRSESRVLLIVANQLFDKPLSLLPSDEVRLAFVGGTTGLGYVQSASFPPHLPRYMNGPTGYNVSIAATNYSNVMSDTVVVVVSPGSIWELPHGSVVAPPPLPSNASLTLIVNRNYTIPAGLQFTTKSVTSYAQGATLCAADGSAVRWCYPATPQTMPDVAALRIVLAGSPFKRCYIGAAGATAATYHWIEGFAAGLPFSLTWAAGEPNQTPSYATVRTSPADIADYTGVSDGGASPDSVCCQCVDWGFLFLSNTSEPVADVAQRLFPWTPTEVTRTATAFASRTKTTTGTGTQKAVTRTPSPTRSPTVIREGTRTATTSVTQWPMTLTRTFVRAMLTRTNVLMATNATPAPITNSTPPSLTGAPLLSPAVTDTTAAVTSVAGAYLLPTGASQPTRLALGGFASQCGEPLPASPDYYEHPLQALVPSSLFGLPASQARHAAGLVSSLAASVIFAVPAAVSMAIPSRVSTELQGLAAVAFIAPAAVLLPSVVGTVAAFGYRGWSPGLCVVAVCAVGTLFAAQVITVTRFVALDDDALLTSDTSPQGLAADGTGKGHRNGRSSASEWWYARRHLICVATDGTRRYELRPGGVARWLVCRLYLVDQGSTLILSALAGLRPESADRRAAACLYPALAATLLAMALWLYVVSLRPFAQPTEQRFATLIFTVQLACFATATASILAGDKDRRSLLDAVTSRLQLAGLAVYLLEMVVLALLELRAAASRRTNSSLLQRAEPAAFDPDATGSGLPLLLVANHHPPSWEQAGRTQEDRSPAVRCNPLPTVS